MRDEGDLWNNMIYDQNDYPSPSESENQAHSTAKFGENNYTPQMKNHFIWEEHGFRGNVYSQEPYQEPEDGPISNANFYPSGNEEN